MPLTSKKSFCSQPFDQKSNSMAGRVLVFGTFDGLHRGHHFFLRQAKLRGTELVVAVARDVHVRELKNKIPVHREQARLGAIEALPFVDRVLLSDEALGSFAVIDLIEPDLVVLGHDQAALEESLRAWMTSHERYVPIIRMKKTPL